MKRVISLLFSSLLCLSLVAQSFPKADKRGNPIPDYSYCGYKASNEQIPYVEVKAFVPTVQGDATAHIQAAIDYVSSLPLDASGFRGAVQLDRGQYQLEGGLHIAASGVVLRGSGSAEDGTELLGLGQDRTTMIRLAGRLDRMWSSKQAIASAVTVGDMFIRVANTEAYQVDQCLMISRWASQEWIDQMDMNDFGGESSYIGWKVGDKNRPSDVEIHWERQIVAISGDTLFLDAPLTCSMSETEGFVYVQQWPGRIAQSAVENLRLSSQYDTQNPKDENHRWNAIDIDNAEDVWVRRVQFRHFAGSAVFVTENVRRVTVEDCQSFAPVSEIGGSRRYTFHTLGGQCLFQRLYAEQGFHDFSTGRLAPGPNAFVQCQADWSHHMSGAIDAWATGVLFDCFNGEGVLLSYANRGQDGMGAGWTAGNSMMWNCSAAMLANPNPPTANNWAYGAWGQMQGRFESADSFVKPHSLFYAQLAARQAATKDDVKKLMPYDTQSASNPPIDKAQRFVAAARRPAMKLVDWIDSLQVKDPLPLVASDKSLLKWQKLYQNRTKQVDAQPSLMTLQNGILLKDDAILTGRSQTVVWWNGSLKARYLATNQRPHITRWVPGRSGTGFTDNLDEMTDMMKATGHLTTNHHYGLWYDRRRDDHERIRRMDGYVWAPFYEQPFARSGQGVAYDGLSKYDLTKWNVWYWNRLKTYADLADEKGLVLYHQHFFQHNIIEAGAHWADCPWRSANNINDMGFPEPVPYAVDKRVFMSEHFYDVSHEGRRELYRGYIRKSLDNFADNGSVIHFISEEYTGPLHFVEFWLDVIAEWEAETGHDAKVALSCTKDVQDAILADPKRSKTVDIIDIKYWHPTMTGFSAPPGGVHLAPRQYGRLRSANFSVKEEVKARNMQERVRDVIADYRQRFPEKAVLMTANADVWAALMGGASLCALPTALPQAFREDVAQMLPMENKEVMQMGKPGVGYVFYAPAAENITIDLQADKQKYQACWINPRNGKPVGESFKVKADEVLTLEKQGILWLYR